MKRHRWQLKIVFLLLGRSIFFTIMLYINLYIYICNIEKHLTIIDIYYYIYIRIIYKVFLLRLLPSVRIPFTTMVELTNSVLMSPTHVRFRCDPEIEAYVDALFCESISTY
jgi:hypothetical protein